MQRMVRPCSTPRCALTAHLSLSPPPLCAPLCTPSTPLQARDRLRQFGQDRKANVTPPASHAAEAELCGRLGAAMAAAKGDKALELALWDDNWQTVYALAEATMARTMSEFMDE
jgi:hypothetical protein